MRLFNYRAALQPTPRPAAEPKGGGASEVLAAIRMEAEQLMLSVRPAAAAAPAAPAAAVTGGGAKPWLELGARSEDVKVLQQRLKELGFDPGPIDGYFGPVTERAVKAYQQANGRTVDGAVGPKTWGSLGFEGLPKDAAAPAPAPAPAPVPVPAPVPITGSPHDRRDQWFFSQQPTSRWNPNEDAAGNGNCGPTAVTMVAKAFGKINPDAAGADAAIEETRRRTGDSRSEYQGTSFAGLVRAAQSYGLAPEMRYNMRTIEQVEAELAKGNLVIAHVKATYLRANPTSGHYTVVTAVKDGRVYLNDSSNKEGPMSISIAEFWTAVKARGTYAMISIGQG
ncbi:MAG: peptidoglycan-binding protein [Candidatus Sericytochromatia bacterium]